MAFAPIAVRPARPEDRDFVLRTAGRLAEFGPPPWRKAAHVVEAESRTLRAFFDSPLPHPGVALLIAESESGERLGFAYLETLVDFFTQKPHGHVAELAVTREAEGRGAGSALLSAAEGWSRARGHALITLNVFDGNRRARAVYEKVGYRPETIRYIKTLG